MILSDGRRIMPRSNRNLLRGKETDRIIEMHPDFRMIDQSERKLKIKLIDIYVNIHTQTYTRAITFFLFGYHENAYIVIRSKPKFGSCYQ